MLRNVEGRGSLKTQVHNSEEETGAPVVTLRRTILRAGRTGWHAHQRTQLLYATEGLMVVSTEDGTWMVPTGFAMVISPSTRHDAACEGRLGLCTAYIDPTAIQGMADAPPCRMVRVSALLDAALRALAEDSDSAYDADGRTGLLTRVVISELERAESIQFVLPMPRDHRLRRICSLLMEEPSLSADIDDWAAAAGLSRRTMTRKFKDETSLSFGEWRRRLRAARAMMQSSSGIPIHKVLDVVGYKTVHGLRGMLKRHVTAEDSSEEALPPAPGA
ncbi:AraC family transcriptional regulator [Azorhizobium oxalatiphilum]|uniref:AraC family transcriptional regulator n=1 Tax=Azorhizobium oxalatiphilum TaxID=980631 RepID=A0A917BP14_9HYPH|nr:helix-turn-helix domain-containing protein [Azorhizobium oxalatiphilum]GGF50734.1 AraC family transcriptional regulator [Azorhizobium oxalatiphilum]